MNSAKTGNVTIISAEILKMTVASIVYRWRHTKIRLELCTWPEGGRKPILLHAHTSACTRHLRHRRQHEKATPISCSTAVTSICRSSTGICHKRRYVATDLFALLCIYHVHFIHSHLRYRAFRRLLLPRSTPRFCQSTTLQY